MKTGLVWFYSELTNNCFTFSRHIKKKDDINDVESFLSKVLDPRDPDTRRLREVFIRRWDADQDFDDQLDGLRVSKPRRFHTACKPGY